MLVDGHCDSISSHLAGERNLARIDSGGSLDLPGLKRAGVTVQFFASFIESQHKPGHKAVLRGLDLVEGCLKLIEENPEYLLLFENSQSISRAVESKRTAALLSVEGGEVLGGRLFMLSVLYRLGVRSICLTWNQANELAGGVEEPGGLTPFGTKAVQEMNRLGMLLDLSHLSDPAFWDVLRVSVKPVIASHSCCRALHNHPRNLTDEQLVSLVRNGGVVGINFYNRFLTGGKASLDDVIRHIKHVCTLVGPEHVGLGSDFDGCEELPVGLEHVSCLPNLVQALLKAGFSQADTAKIAGGNFIRVIREVVG